MRGKIMSTTRVARSKALGESIEELVVDVVDQLEPADARDGWYDVIATDALAPDPEIGLRFGSIAILERETRVEIKATRLRVSNGSDRDRDGCWLFRRDQHDQLLEDSASYLLVVYQESPSGSTVIQQMLVVPATIVDELLRQRWYSVDRPAGEFAQLPWSSVLELDDVLLEIVAPVVDDDPDRILGIDYERCPICGFTPHYRLPSRIVCCRCEDSRLSEDPGGDPSVE